MTLDQVKILVRTSNKIFIWSWLSRQCGAYFNISKTAVQEYLNSVTANDDFPVEIDELGDLYLGSNVEI